ncbi:MAG: hypothetical protein RRX92_04735 [Lachnospiraceae bacterium]
MKNNQNNAMEILQEVQRNTSMGMHAVDTISAKVYDDDLAMQLSIQSAKYADIHNQAIQEMLKAREMPLPDNAVQTFMLSSGIHMNTLLNTSTSHIAELLIRGTNMGLTQMWKSMNQYGQTEGVCLEIAKELIDFEEKNIARLKKYL